MTPFFLPAPAGQRLCLLHEPRAALRGAIVYAHPWAEEMNKSRRMAAMQSRALADAGFAVLQIDLMGCGDSSGDLADASWQGWVDDLVLAADWLSKRHDAPLWFWGLRAGALLATQAAAQRAQACNLLYWQPALSGKQLLQQFLRLKAAADLQQGDAKATLERARAALAGGGCVEVAGYALPAALALGLEAATLELPARAVRIVWLETSTRDPAGLLPPSVACIEKWRGAGSTIQALAVTGPAFWQTQEIEDAPALIAATLAQLCDPLTQGATA